jgi:putative heme degradation protein
MMARTRAALGNEIQQRARQRANDLGVSLSEYARRLVAHDLARLEAVANVVCVFDLSSSSGSGIARNKDSMIAEALQAAQGIPWQI